MGLDLILMSAAVGGQDRAMESVTPAQAQKGDLLPAFSGHEAVRRKSSPSGSLLGCRERGLL